MTRAWWGPLILLLALGAGLGGCGQKGDLYLPEKGAPKSSASDAER